jgi:hypothetical protein
MPRVVPLVSKTSDAAAGSNVASATSLNAGAGIAGICSHEAGADLTSRYAQ